jgi:hypothetical protein
VTVREYRYLGPDGEGVESLPDGVGAALGSDYCVHLLPSPARMREVAAAASGRRVPLVLLTPYFRDGELKRAVPLFRAIPEGADVDVAVNDWGALLTLRGLFPRMTLSVGRLLSGQKRCPRIGVSARLTEEGRALQGDGLFSSARAREHLAAEYGIKGFHLDDLPWGGGIRARAVEGAGGTRFYVHSPWAVVTVSDDCPWIGGVSSARLETCDRPCRGSAVRLANRSMGGDLFQRGKARFTQMESGEGGPPGVKTPWARILCPEIP